MPDSPTMPRPRGASPGVANDATPHHWRDSLRTRLILLMGFLLLLGMFSTGVESWSVMLRTVGEGEQERLAEIAHDQAMALRQRLDGVQRDTLMLAAAPAIRSVARSHEAGDGAEWKLPFTTATAQIWMPESAWRPFAGSLLQSLLASNGDYDMAALVKADGTELIRVERHGDDLVNVDPLALGSLAKRGYFRSGQVRPEGEVLLSGIILEYGWRRIEAPLATVVYASTPVTHVDGSLFGFILLKADLTGFLAAARQVVPLGGRVLLADGRGRLLHSWPPAWAGAAPAPESLEDGALSREFAAATPLPVDGHVSRWRGRLDAVTGEVQMAGAHDLVLGGEGPGHQVRIIYTEPASQVLAEVMRLRWPIVSAGIVKSVTALLLMAWLVSRLLRPLTQMTAQIGGLRAEQLSVRLPVGRRDEIGRLARAFQRLLGDIIQQQQALTREITQRRATEDELRRMAVAIEHAPDAIIIHDRQGRVIYINPACRRLTGVTLDSVTAQQPRGGFAGGDDPSVYRGMWATVCAGNEWTGEVHVRTPHGLRTADVRVSPIRNAAGDITHTVSILRDVTESRALARQLASARKLESIGQLAAGIAHEVNTPAQYVGDNLRFLQDSFTELDALLARLEAIRDAPDPRAALASAMAGTELDFLRAEIPGALAQSIEGIDRVSHIVKAMKEFSHPAEDKTPVDLNRAIASTITVATNEWKYVADVETDFDADLPLVSCLPGEFNQVVLNMLVNAAHAIGDVVGDGARGKGTIRVATRRVGEMAEIRIGDTGGGIPEAIRERIFDPFFTTKEVGKGTGQGLSIAFDVIVNKHGGRIDVESTVGEGTTFIIRLPLEARTTGVTGEDRAA